MKKILLVDDEEVNRKLLKVYLTKLDYETKEASDGLQALERLQEEDFDLLICDVLMPNMDGWEVLRQLRLDVRLRNIPVILLTARDEDADMFRGYELGANYYLTKPLKKSQLLYAMNLMFNEEQ